MEAREDIAVQAMRPLMTGAPVIPFEAGKDI
jgi:hypothetical protein